MSRKPANKPLRPPWSEWTVVVACPLMTCPTGRHMQHTKTYKEHRARAWRNEWRNERRGDAKAVSG